MLFNMPERAKKSTCTQPVFAVPFDFASGLILGISGENGQEPLPVALSLRLLYNFY